MDQFRPTCPGKADRPRSHQARTNPRSPHTTYPKLLGWSIHTCCVKFRAWDPASVSSGISKTRVSMSLIHRGLSLCGPIVATQGQFSPRADATFRISCLLDNISPRQPTGEFLKELSDLRI